MTEEETKRFLKAHVLTLSACVRRQGFSITDPGFWMDKPEDDEFRGWAMFGTLDPEEPNAVVVLGFAYLDMTHGRSVVSDVNELFIEEEDDPDLT